jgi:peptidoglycan/xylan/chitin deacetylase (PgdA/CDA1 family)
MMSLRSVRHLAAVKVAMQRKPARTSAPDVRFLCYHSVAQGHLAPALARTPTISAETLRDQVQVVRQRRLALISMDEALEILRVGSTVRGGAVCVTFDDGYADNFEVAWPILQELRCPAHFFVSSELMDRGASLNTRSTPAAERYATRDQLRQMIREGATVGSHGATHTDLRGASVGALEREVRASRERLQQALGVSIDTFAYPFGALDRAASDASEQAGYAAAFIVRLGTPRFGSTNMQAIPRTIVEHNEEIATFDLKIRGGFDWVESYSAARHWLTSRRRNTPRAGASA